MEMSKVDDWLEGIPSKATQKSYLNGLKTFEKFYNNGVETLIGSKDAGKVVEKFNSTDDWIRFRLHSCWNLRSLDDNPYLVGRQNTSKRTGRILRIH